jgi:perosamine synthetase
MIVAKDQFWSWAMISFRQWEPSALPSVQAPRYSFFLARNAIYHGLRLLEIPQGAEILVPAYLCRAAIDPLLAYGAEVGFYSVKRDCEPDLADIERRITPRTKAILSAHYFGFPQPIKQIRELCDDYNLALLEDCAHVLCGEVEGAALGAFGDIAVFSWRKFLPTYDGAELVVNSARQVVGIDWARESSLFTLKVGVNMMEGGLGHVRQPFLKLIYRSFRLTEAGARKCAARYLRSIASTLPHSDTLSFDLQTANWPMSRLSRWTRNHSNLRQIVARRRRNYEILREQLSCLNGVRPLFSDLPSGVCPWVFAVFFNDLPAAHLLLRDRGIPAVTWNGVRHPRIPRGAFIEADFLYDNLVFLPVHQCLDDEDMFKMVGTVKSLCGQ